MSATKLIYLASPYSGGDLELRFIEVCRCAANLISLGHLVFSPIAHTHPIAKYGGLATGYNAWDTFDTRMVLHCDELWVCTLEGWALSQGVMSEVKTALTHVKPVAFCNPLGIPQRFTAKLTNGQVIYAPLQP